MRGRATLKFGLVVVGTAIVHFVVTFMSLGAVMAEAFGGARPGAGLLAGMFVYLGFPATAIIGRWVPSLVELPNEMFFSLMGGTSLLWGTIVGLLWRWWYLRTRGAAKKDPDKLPAPKQVGGGS